MQRDDCHVITYIHNYIIDLANESHFHGDVSGNHPSVESHPLSPGCHLEEEVVERTRIDFIAVSTNACMPYTCERSAHGGRYLCARKLNSGLESADEVAERKRASEIANRENDD